EQGDPHRRADQTLAAEPIDEGLRGATSGEGHLFGELQGRFERELAGEVGGRGLGRDAPWVVSSGAGVPEGSLLAQPFADELLAESGESAQSADAEGGQGPRGLIIAQRTDRQRGEKLW